MTRHQDDDLQLAVLVWLVVAGTERHAEGAFERWASVAGLRYFVEVRQISALLLAGQAFITLAGVEALTSPHPYGTRKE